MVRLSVRRTVFFAVFKHFPTFAANNKNDQLCSKVIPKGFTPSH